MCQLPLGTLNLQHLCAPTEFLHELVFQSQQSTAFLEWFMFSYVLADLMFLMAL